MMNGMKRRVSAAALCAALFCVFCFAGCKKPNLKLDDGTSAADETTPSLSDAQETASAPELSWTQPASVAEFVTEAPAAGNPVPTQRVGTGLNPLTGMPGYDGEYYAGRRAIGVVVENHPGARPQWGMSTPDVVVEYEVEGGISRMLWLYANEDELPAKIGPVRSMRHDIVELARGWDLAFVHCGGSAPAKNKLASYAGALQELDAMYTDACFTRDSSRGAAYEHTLILLGDRFRASYGSLGLDLNGDAGRYYFRFADASAPFRPGTEECASVHFEYSSYYTYTFTYNMHTGMYEASINGEPRVDDQGIRCAYKNALLLYTDMVSMVEESKLQDLALERGGDGIYFCNGGCTTVRWAKGTDTDPLRLFGPDGNELLLNAGNSYIGFVRSTQRDKTVIS